MDCARRKILVLITTLVYTIFACNYVLFCKRNIGAVSPNMAYSTLVAKQAGNVAEIIRGISSQGLPVSHKFLSKPRVVTNRLTLPDFSILALTFLLLFTLFEKKRQSFFAADIFSYPHPCPGIIFFQNWRI
jgi:hypothetical protein